MKKLIIVSILMMLSVSLMSQSLDPIPDHTWLAQNWELVALIVSEALALIPTEKKVGGILRTVWSVFVYVFKPKNKK